MERKGFNDEVQPEACGSMEQKKICRRCHRECHIKTRDQNDMQSSTLVGGWPTPLKNMSSSVGMMTFPNIWKVIKDVPNHQPGPPIFRCEITGMMVNHTSAPLNSRLKWPVWLLRQSNHCWSIMNTISTNKQAIPKTEYHTSVVWPT